MNHDEIVELWRIIKGFPDCQNSREIQYRLSLIDRLIEELKSDALLLDNGKIVIEHEGNLFEVNLR